MGVERVGSQQIRPASSADADFIVQVVEQTMRRYVEQVWGRFDEAANRKRVAATIAEGNYAIVQEGGVDAGVLSVERQSDFIWLAQLFILPAYQNRGIGSRIVRALAEEAAASRKPLRLRVLVSNPAIKLYAREGFVVCAKTPQRVYMQWSPKGLEPTSAEPWYRSFEA